MLLFGSPLPSSADVTNIEQTAPDIQQSIGR
jgi:hypothetical protein